MRNYTARLTLFTVCISLLFAVIGCSESSSSSQLSGEYLNPGAPMAPTANEDWYDLLSREETMGISPQEMKSQMEIDPLLRTAATGLELAPNWVTPVAQTLSDGTVVMGYTLRYDDRIALIITPTDRVMDPAAEAQERTIDPDVNRVTHPWRLTSVRGVKGLARNGTVQKWQSGDEMALPSAIDWQEPSDGPAPYVRYTLIGDVPVGQLQAIAAQLR